MITLNYRHTIKPLIICSMFYLGGCAGYQSALDTSTCEARGGTVQFVCVGWNTDTTCHTKENRCWGGMSHDEYYKEVEQTQQKIGSGHAGQAASSPNKALTDAAYDGDATKVRYMLEKGANINHIDKHGGTALMNASLNGHGTIVKSLLAKGAKLDLQSKDGWTALMMASKRGHEAIVKMLLSKGAAVNHKGKYERTAIDVAKTEKIRQLLKAAGAI